MLVDNALLEENGVICYHSECLFCEKQVYWYAPVKAVYADVNNKVKAEVVVEKPKIVSGKKSWADFTVYFECPYCAIKNKVEEIKMVIS